MSNPRWFQATTVLFVIAVFCAFTQVAIARPRAVVVQQPQIPPSTYPNPGLYGVTQAFFTSPYPNWINNSDGVELWPCFGNQDDCSSIGNPSIPFYGVATGKPLFTWSLSACDGTTNGTQNPYSLGETWDATAINGFYIPCGQINNFYQDYSGDTTDDILWRAEVTQGGNLIADTGVEDWGPNPFAGDIVVFYEDFNFGTLGDEGPNNGNCVPNYNYPDTIPPVLTYPVITAGGHTCVDPVSGPATISVYTSIATPTWTCKDKLGVVNCTVKYKTVYSLKQQWSIYLQ